MTKKTYEVGYGKPPKSSQFKPGRSGNPKGRPKGARSVTAITQRELNAKISVTEGGRVKSISKLEAIVKSLFAKAAKGDAKCIQLLLSLGGLRADTAETQDLSAIDELILANYLKRHAGGADGAT